MQRSLFKRLQTTTVSVSGQQQALVSHLNRQRLKDIFLKTQRVFLAHQYGSKRVSFATLPRAWLMNGCGLVHIPGWACRDVKQACFIRLHIS